MTKLLVVTASAKDLQEIVNKEMKSVEARTVNFEVLSTAITQHQ
jgi:hypothetical protein